MYKYCEVTEIGIDKLNKMIIKVVFFFSFLMTNLDEFYKFSTNFNKYLIADSKIVKRRSR